MYTSLVLNFAAVLLAIGLLSLCGWLHIRLWLDSRRLLRGLRGPDGSTPCEKPASRPSDLDQSERGLSDPQAKFKQRYRTLSVLDTTGEYADLAFDRQGPDTRLVA